MFKFAHLLISQPCLFFWLSNSTKKEIPLSEVKSIAIKEHFGNKTPEIHFEEFSDRNSFIY
jgi:hypothetical protein